MGAHASASAISDATKAPPRCLSCAVAAAASMALRGGGTAAGQLGEKEVELGALAEPQAQEPDRAVEPLRQTLEDVDELALGAAPGQRRIGVQDRARRERLGLE